MVDKEIWDEMDAASDAAQQVVPQVVGRYRCLGTLTWALIHKIEAEVIAELEVSGKHLPSTLNMIRSSPLLRYPEDDRPASFSNDSICPIIFGQIEKAWKFVH